MRWRWPTARSARWCTWSPPGCAGSGSTVSTTPPAPRSPPGLVTWLPEPPDSDDPEVAALAQRVLRAHLDYLAGMGAQLEPVEAALPAVAYRVAERMVLDPADRQRVLEGGDAATRLRTVLALLRRESAIVGRFGAVPTPPDPSGASLN